MKDISLFFFWNADTCIFYFNRPFLLRCSYCNIDNPFLRIFQGIRKEIVHNMIHLIPVHPHLRHVRLCLQLNFHSLLQDGHVELRYLFFQISFDIVRRDFQTFGMQFRFL